MDDDATDAYDVDKDESDEDDFDDDVADDVVASAIDCVDAATSQEPWAEEGAVETACPTMFASLAPGVGRATQRLR